MGVAIGNEVTTVSLRSESKPGTQDGNRWLEAEWSEDSMTLSRET